MEARKELLTVDEVGIDKVRLPAADDGLGGMTLVDTQLRSCG